MFLLHLSLITTVDMISDLQMQFEKNVFYFFNDISSGEFFLWPVSPVHMCHVSCLTRENLQNNCISLKFFVVEELRESQR